MIICFIKSNETNIYHYYLLSSHLLTVLDASLAAVLTLLLRLATASLKLSSSPMMKMATIYPPAAIIVRVIMLKIDSIMWRLKSIKSELPVRSAPVL